MRCSQPKPIIVGMGLICTILYWLDRKIDGFRNSYFGKTQSTAVGNPGSNICGQRGHTCMNMGSGRSFWFAAGPANDDLSWPSSSRRSNPNSTASGTVRYNPALAVPRITRMGSFCHVRRHIGYSFCLLAPDRERGMISRLASQKIL